MSSITKSVVRALTPTITAGAYSTGDAVGGMLTFPDMFEAGFHTGILQSVVIVDDAKQSVKLELHLFDQTFTATADNAAFDPSDADLENYLGFVTIEATDYADFTDNSAALVSNVGLLIKSGAPSTSVALFGQLVVRGTPTYAATDDLTIKVGVLQD